jgi:hypothetical protein
VDTVYNRITRKLDFDHLIAVIIDGWRPTDTLLARWTSGFVCLPIDGKTRGVEAQLFFGLPLVVSSGRRDQIDPMNVTTLDTLFPFRVIGIGKVLCGQQLFF